MFLFVAGCFRERDIGGWPICVWYGILTASELASAVAAAATEVRAVVRQSCAKTGGSGSRLRSSSRSTSWRDASAPQIERPLHRRHIHLRFEGADEAVSNQSR
jgi:hypothetical protein